MFFLVGLLIGVPLLLIWFYLRRQAQASLRWPTVPGRIVDSRLIQTRDADGDAAPTAAVTYAYAAGGLTLQGNRVSIGGRDARSVVEKYPAGTDVQVAYDPNKPSSAVLEPGGAGMNALLALGVIVIVACILLGVFFQRADAQPYRAAKDLYDQGKFGEARPAFEQLAQSGSTEAKVYLGVMYAKGQGVPQDFVEAQKWFILAGDSGKKNRQAIQAGITAAQQQLAESKALAWKPNE